MNHGEARIFLVEEPVVAAADPFDPEGRTAEIASRPSLPPVPLISDPIVAGPGQRNWARRFVRVLAHDGLRLLPVAALSAVPMHFFVGRLDDTVVAAPALVELAGGVGLLLLPIMWLAYLAVSALPFVLGLAGAVGVTVPRAADGVALRPGRVWSLVAMRLRVLWLWLAAVAVVTGSLPLLLAEERLGPAASVPLLLVHALVATGLVTLGGMLGCVVLIERGHRPRRAIHLLGQVRPVGLIVAAAAVTVLPRVADGLFGGVVATLAGVLLVQVWAVAALVTYAQARRVEEPVTSESLRHELAAPEE